MTEHPNRTTIRPSGSLQILSYKEATQLCDQTQEGLNDLFRQCALAVLNTGLVDDNGLALIEAHPDFQIRVQVKGRGLQIEIENAPNNAFLEDDMIVGLQEHLSAVIRDLIYAKNEIVDNGEFDLEDTFGITNAVFHLARNAELMQPNREPNVVICWGGHSISRVEYKYTKQVGYHLGLRQLDICTGCGPGAMKGPMKGAVVGHGKQRYQDGRFIGLTEPGIIAAEAPNAIVNQLAILPDIEKRLEAFLRLGHGIIIFPGGAGTMEEILYLLSVIMHPQNNNIPFPVVLTGPECSRAYFDAVLEFIEFTLGRKASDKLTVLIDEPIETALFLKKGLGHVKAYREATSDAYYFNWNLHIPFELQKPFEPTHDNIAQLRIHRDQPEHQLASQLRQVFSAIVAGNVKREGMAQIEAHGPFQIQGDPEIMRRMDKLLRAFVEQRRMKLGTENYVPCYHIVTDMSA
ncbi:MAG: nucleotide 5'-monophosphate nucleosidase PpnN [Hydrogenovibrio sp.]|uniref:nucleotide 5'-monophosphate nucleosidase PpnN n=1 Tax=Hydrogenovibrio TaxID=28884 RepID=UPI00035F5A40|nr:MULTISPECIES: nucleotide 5'-monophosphate nucleosidase PpnN [Hydrogenovibrio]MDR9498984.1 nucleotide 5'-monophosphate nucleosidase PpnN [Hydrogenovibrio sp.]